jgi:hypothetical protein
MPMPPAPAPYLGDIEFGDAIDRLGGARLVLTAALAAIRRGR